MSRECFISRHNRHRISRSTAIVAVVKKEDFLKHEYSENCEGCRRLRTGNMSSRPHSKACRIRMEKLFEAEDNPRWRSAKDRKEEDFWRHIKEQEEAMAKD